MESLIKTCLIVYVILSLLVMAISAQFCNTSFSIDLEDNLEAEFDTIETTTEVLYEDYGDNATGKEIVISLRLTPERFMFYWRYFL